MKEIEVTEVRDYTVIVDVMLGQVAVQSQMHTKRIGEKLLPTVRRIIVKLAVWIPSYLLAVEVIETEIETVIGNVIETEI